MFSDITTSSIEKLAEKPVWVQGTEISLKEIIPAEFPLAKVTPLVLY